MKRIKPRRQDRFLFERRLISVAVMSAISSHAGANPTGAQVVHGQASITTQGSVLTVTNSPNSIVNWQSFSIGGNETTRFVQQSAASAVLNRVVGVDPSVILGTLQSNGKVFLINPSGILFGQGARVDVAGLVASTLNLNDVDFLAGRLNFESGALSGSVINRGAIATPEGGSVFLVGSAVENSGIIHAPGGEVILAAGQSVRLGSTAAPNVLVEIEAPANRAVNLGEIAVGAGKAGIYGGFVEQKGIVSADTVTRNAAGKIVFKASRDITVAAASATSASGVQGGLVTIESAGTTVVNGVVSAAGASGAGGSIHLLGNQVGVSGSAVVDASGTAGGGTILVGGDYKGGNPNVGNARATFLGGDTVLRADATATGGGGRIIVWSDEATRAYGRISARGGPQGGDAGFVETSSGGFLQVTRAPDLTAPMGIGGAWLLDPYDIIVSTTPGQLTNNSGAPNFTPSGDTSIIGADLIGAQLSTGASVTLDTSGSGSLPAGNIVVDGSILKTGGAAASLTLKAHNSIYLQAGSRIESSADALTLTLDADQDTSGAGAVSLNLTSIITNGGDLVIGGGADPLTGFAASSATDLTSGVAVFDSTIATGAGDISIRGRTSVAAGQFGDGVNLGGSTFIQTTTGEVNIRGEASGRSGDVNFAAGVRVGSTARISSTTGTILLDGVGAGTPGSPATSGTSGVVVQNSGRLEVTGAGRIELVGNAGTSSYSGGGVEGVTLLDQAQLLAENGGAIVLTGSPGTPAPGAAVQNGVSLNSVSSNPGVTVRAGGASGSITITGLPANGTVLQNANGVVLQQAGTLVQATGGATITIDGTGSDTSIVDGDAGTQGLLMFAGARIQSQSGAITITGRGGLTTATGRSASGVALFDTGTAIETIDGAIHITGTGGGTLANPSGQLAHGITMQSGAIQATGTGTISLTGTAGVTAGVFDPDYTHLLPGGGIASHSHGVELGGGSRIATNSGDIEIVGSGAAVLTDAVNASGVLLFGNSTAVQSVSGSISITGTGGGTPAGRAGGDTLGVLLFNQASVITGGAGFIEITGAGGATSGGIGIGVSIFGGSSVEAHDGDITLRGTGSLSTNTFLAQGDFANGGVEVGSDTGSGAISRVRTSGTGSVHVDGTAGAAAGGGNRGVAIFEGSVVEARGTGAVTLEGRMSSAQLNDVAAAVVGDGNNGGVWIASGSMVRSGGDVVSGGGAITITGFGPVDGTGAPSTPQIFGVRIEGGSTVESFAGGVIAVTGGVLDSRAAGLQGVDITGSSSVLGHAADITITGTGGGANRSDADGVAVTAGAAVETSSGHISVTGWLVNFPNPDGRYLQGVAVAGGAVRTTAGGSITIDGTGPGTLGNPIKSNSGGIAIVDGATVETQAGGDITLIGTGGFATDGFISGVYISSDVVFVGTDPGTQPGAPVVVSATGGGEVTITGFLGSPGLHNGTDSAGVSIMGLGTPAPGSGAGRTRGATVTTEDGALTITGYGPGFVRGPSPSIDEALAGAGQTQAIYIAEDASVGSTGSGAVRLEGDGGVVRGYLKDSFANPGTPVLGVDATGVTIERSATVFSTGGALDVVAQGGYSNNANALFFGFPADTVATESAAAFIAGGNAEFPTMLSSVSGGITIAATASGTLAAPIGSGVAAGFGFGDVRIATGAANTITIRGDGGVVTNGGTAGVWFRDGTVTLDAGTVSLLGNTVTAAVSTNTGSDPRIMSGIELYNADVQASGVLVATGVGGNAANGQNYGIWLRAASTLASTGATGSATLTGTGGPNAGSAGISIEGASAVSAVGDVVLTSVQGDLLVLGTTLPAAVTSSQGDVIVSTPGVLRLDTIAFTAGGNIELHTDDLQDTSSTFTTGAADSNYFRLTPTTPGTDLDLTLLDPSGVFAPHIQLGTPGTANTFGSVFVRDDVSDAEFETITKSLEIYANRVDINGQLGPFGTPLTRAIVVEARGDINIGNEATSAGIRVRDADIRLIADADGNGTGNLSVIGGDGPSDFVQVYVEQIGAVTAPGMELRGVDISFRDAQSVYVDGAGALVIAAQNDVLLSNAGAGFLSVGGQTLTTLTAGGDLTIESLGDGAATLSGAGSNSGAKSIDVAGDMLIRNGSFANSEAQVYSAAGDQAITARSIRIEGAAGGSDLGILSGGGAQTITTSGNGATGWGIQVINNGSLDGSGNGAFINSNGSQQITAANGGGILLDGAGGPVDVWAGGVQTIVLDGSGGNALELRGGPGEVIVGGHGQTITAGTGANPGSITLRGGSVLNSTAAIYNQADAQTISTTGLLQIIAGTALGGTQGSFHCDAGACGNLGNLAAGEDQVINAGSIVIRGGAAGPWNEANLWGNGNQTVTAGGIAVFGGAGEGNWGSLAATGGAAFTQHVTFGAGGLHLESGSGGGSSNSTGNVYSDGIQVISGTGDITLVGGVAGVRAWAEITAGTSQDITARSISITNRAGPSSTGIFTPDGLQRIATTGAAANGYGITIRNLGATGVDQNSSPASAYIYDRAGTQIIDVADSNGILMEGIGGPVFLGTDGVEQTITLHGSGANRLDLSAGLGSAVVSFSNGTAQTITAGAVHLAGGSADGAAAVIVAHDGTQTLEVAGTVSLAGGSAPGPAIPDLSNPPADCIPVSACAVVAAHGDLQTITADGISITGGSAGTENLATIRGDFGQDITVGSGGVTMQGGGGPGLRNFAFIESYSGDQILRFAGGAALSLTGGTDGSKHFAAVEAMGATASQQILGNPVITLTGGASGGGDGTGSFVTFKGNNAAIVTDPGTVASQIIHAQSIDMQGGGGIDNNAHIGVWGTGASQAIAVAGDVRLRGGSAPNTLAEILAFGDQSISAGSILLEAGGSGGPGNSASIRMNQPGHSQTLSFGGELTLLAEQAGADGNFAEVLSSGTQTIAGSGDIRLAGGVSGGRSWADIIGIQGQDISARALSVTAVAGSVSVFLYNDTGTQAIRTSGGEGGDPGAFGVTLRNLGSTGPDQAGYPAGAAITSRWGVQVIDVADSAGLRVLGEQGLAIINSGQFVDGVVDAPGTSQSITVHGAGANSILVQAGTGQAAIDAYSTGAQTLVAGEPGETGSISILGGTAAAAFANVAAHGGAQTITTRGALTLRSTGAGEVLLGNVLEPAQPSAGTHAVDITAGTLALEAGNIWGDDGIVLRLAGGGSATGGAIHAGRASAPTSGGDIVVDPGTFVALEGSLTLAGSVDIGDSTGRLELTGGTLTVGAGVDNSGLLQLRTSGTNVAAALVVSGGQLVNAPGAVLQSLTAGGAAVTTVNAAGGVVNQGTLDIDHTLRVSNTSRTFDTRAGTLEIAPTEALEIGNGTVRLASTTGRGAGTGKLNLQGTVTLMLEDDVTLSPAGFQLGLGGGVVTIDAAAPVTVTNLGNLALSGTTFTTDVELDNQGTLTVAAGRTAVLDGGLVQTGTIDLVGGTVSGPTLTVAGGFTNAGTIMLRTSASNQAVGMNVTGGQLINTGSITVSSLGGIAASTLNADLLNQSTLAVQHNLVLDGTQTGGNTGTITVATGATLDINSDFTNATGGVIQGAGTIDVSGFALTNSGTLRAGTSPGTLSITGDLTLTSASVLEVELGGTGAGQFDVIAVSGAATLGGTLDIALVNGYTGGLDDSFRILTAGSVAGTFSAVNAPTDMAFAPDYAATEVTLTLDSLLNRWIAASGDWTIASNWSRGSVPTAEQDVVIDVAGILETIAIPNGSTFDINSLVLSEDLLIESSTLNLAEELVINAGGTLRLFDADVGGAGAVRNSGTILVLPSTASTIARIAESTGQILVQSNTTTLGELHVANGFTNAGTIRLTGGGINAGLAVIAGTLENAGTIISEGASTSSNRLSGTIVNTGTIQIDEDLRLDNVGTTLTQGATGAVSIAAGQLFHLNGGTLDLQGALTIGPNARMRLGAVTVDGSASLLNQGTLMLDSYNTVNAPLDNQGQLEVPVGSNQINGALTQAGTLTLLASAGGAFLNVANGFVNDGTIVLQTGTTGIQPRLTVSNGTLTNDGTIRSEALGGTGPIEISAQILNTGTIDVDHSLVLISHDGRVFDNAGGTLDIAGGSVLYVNGGTTRIGTGTLGASAGALRLQGTSHRLDLAGDVTLPASGWQLDLSNGLVTIDSTVPGGVTLTNQGTLSLTSDVIAANVALVNQGTLVVPGGWGGDVRGMLTQTGTIQVQASAAGNAFFTAANGFTNAGTIELRAGPAAGVSRVTVTSGTLTNAANATLRSVTAGATGANELSAAVTNAGAIDAQHSLTLLSNTGRTFDTSGGTLAITSGSVVTVIGGSTRIGGATLGASQGTLRLSGISHVLDLAGSVTVPASGGWQLDLSNSQVTVDSAVPGGVTLTNLGTLNLAGDRITANVTVDNRPQGVLQVPGGSGATIEGALTNAGTIEVHASAGELTLNGPFTLSGGTVSGTGALVTNAATTVNNGTAVVAWNNFGSMIVNDRLNLDNGATLANQAGASIDLAAGNTNLEPLLWDGTGAAPQLRNLGTITKNAAVDQRVNVALDNAGILNVNSAKLTIAAFTGGTNTGTINLSTGTTLSTEGLALLNASSGVITGTGTLGLGAATLTNAGTLRPGASPGTLHIGGNLALASSSRLNMEIAGTGAGQFDVLDVRGSAALGGTLNVSLPGAYRGAVRDAFPIISAPSVSGAFATVTAPSGMTLVPRNVASGVTLDIDALTNRWSATSGLWTLGSNWALARAPAAGDDVVIDAGGAVSVPDGTLLDAGSVTVNGGTLELQGNAAISSGTRLTVASGILQVANLTNSGTLDVTGGHVATTGALNNTNTGTLNLNGGTLTRAAGAAFGNSGTVNLSNVALSLDGGDGGLGGGSYAVGPGAALQFTAGDYTVGSLSTASGGALAINGATVSAGPLTNAGTATLQSGVLSVGGVANTGTLNLSGGNLARSAGAAFGNAGTVNLNTGTLALDQGDASVGGGTFALQPGTTLRFTGGTHTLGAITGAGAVEVDGSSSAAKLYSGNAMRIAGQTLKVQAGAFAAEVDPPDLTLDVPGGIVLTGGSVDGAYALIQGGNVSITTSTITLTGGAGNGSYAGIDAMTGEATIIAMGDVVLVPGTGSSAGAWMSAAGQLALTALSCSGCDLLPSSPSQSPPSTAGVFGNPVKRSVGAAPLQVPSSVIVGVETAQTGGEGEAIVSEQEAEQKEVEQKEADQKEEKQEEDEQKDQSADDTGTQEEQKNEKPLQVCM